MRASVNKASKVDLWANQNAATDAPVSPYTRSASRAMEPIVKKLNGHKRKHSTSESSGDDVFAVNPVKQRAGSSKKRRRGKVKPSKSVLESDRDASSNVKRYYGAGCRSMPALIVATIKSLSTWQSNEVRKLGFGDILKFNLQSLGRRNLVSWLMDRLDPVDMVIHIGGGKELPVTEQAVKCVLGLPCNGGDIPLYSHAAAAAELVALKRTLGVDQANDISINVLTDRIEAHGEDMISVRCFFLVLLSRLIFPGSSNIITGRDAVVTRNIENFCNINWCKAIVDDLRDVARSWHSKSFSTKTINGCVVFLLLYYLDNLRCSDSIPAVETPRAMFYNTALVSKIATADKFKDRDGNDAYGWLNFRSTAGTCYSTSSPVTSSGSVYKPSHPTHYALPGLSSILGDALRSMSKPKQMAIMDAMKKYDEMTSQAMFEISMAHKKIEDSQNNLANVIRGLLENASDGVDGEMHEVNDGTTPAKASEDRQVVQSDVPCHPADPSFAPWPSSPDASESPELAASDVATTEPVDVEDDEPSTDQHCDETQGSDTTEKLLQFTQGSAVKVDLSDSSNLAAITMVTVVLPPPQPSPSPPRAPCTKVDMARSVLTKKKAAAQESPATARVIKTEPGIGTPAAADSVSDLASPPGFPALPGKATQGGASSSTSSSSCRARELEEKLGAREREAAALAEELEKARAELAGAKAAAVLEYLGSEVHARRLAERERAAYWDGMEDAVGAVQRDLDALRRKAGPLP